MWVRRFAAVATLVGLAACSNNQNIGAFKPLDTPYSSNSSIVRAVQIALREQGYYAGYVTGFMGQSTAFGIQRFQIEHCQRVKPIIDDELLQQLGIEPRSRQLIRTPRLRHPRPLPANTSSDTSGLSEPPASTVQHPD
jgi:peptidoglycan hydrolase-like protein with peptidoglycan-binding domain